MRVCRRCGEEQQAQVAAGGCVKQTKRDSNNKKLFGFVHKYNMDANKFFYYLNDRYYSYNVEHNYKNFSEVEIQIVMKEAKLSRKEAILQLKDKDLSTILIENYLL